MIGFLRIKTFSDLSNLILIIGFFLLPFSTSRSSGLVFSPGFIFIYFASILIFLTCVRARQSMHVLIFAIVLFMFSAMPTIFSIYSSDLFPSLWRAVTYAFGFFIFFGLVFSDRIKRFNKPAYLIVYSTLIVSVYYVFNFIVQSARFGFNNVLIDRSSGGLAELPWGASNVVAAVIFIGLIVVMSDRESQIFKYRNVIIYMMLLGIFVTFSRTIIVSSIILTIIFLIKIRSFRILIVLVLSGFIVSAAYQSSSNENKLYIDRLIADRTSIGKIDSFNGRTEIWKSAIDQIAYNAEPQGYYSAFIKMGHSAHSLYLSTLLEQGIFGLIVLIVLMISLTVLVILNKSIILLSGVLIMFIGLAFEDLFYCQQYVILFFVFSAYVVRRYNEELHL